MNEIATYSMIASKTGLGPSGSECPTKTSILAIDELIIIDNSGSYASRECVRIRDIRKREISSEFVLTVTPTSMAFSPSGGTKSYTVESYKNVTVEGSGTTKEELSWTATISGSGFSNTDSDVTATANDGGERTGSLLITQAESGKTVSISLKQTSADISYNYYLSVDPTSMSFADTGGSQNFTVTSYKKQVVNGVEQSEQIPVTWNSSIDGAGFSISSNTVIAASNPGGSRSGLVTITQAESNKTATISINQQGKPSPWVYTFKINPWESDIANTGGTTSSFTITSTKTKDGVTENVSWSIDNSTLPSWISFNQSNMTFTVQANTGSARNANIYFTQAESGNREFYRINQAKADTPWEYKFSITPTSKTFGWSDTSSVTVNVTSTKSREGVTEQVAWSMSSAVPDWLTYNSANNSFTVSVNNTSSDRSATITYTQAESNKTATIKISQSSKAQMHFLMTLYDRNSNTETTYKDLYWDEPTSSQTIDLGTLPDPTVNIINISLNQTKGEYSLFTTSVQHFISGSYNTMFYVIKSAEVRKLNNSSITFTVKWQFAKTNYTPTFTVGGESSSFSRLTDSNGATFEFPVVSYVDGSNGSHYDNISWFSTIDSNDQDMDITVKNTKVTVGQNNSSENKVAKVRFMQDGAPSPKTITVTINQYGKA